MRVQLQSDHSVTLVENYFIDRFMPAANGEFVKVYLYMLRLAASGADISVSSMADFFVPAEKDITRALTYWEKQGLLRLERDDQRNICEAVFLSCAPAVPAAAPYDAPLQVKTPVISVTAVPETAADTPKDLSASVPAFQPESVTAPLPEEAYPQEKAVPSKGTISPARRKALKDQMDFRQLIFVAETYLGRPLIPTELNTFLYFYDGLKFSCELIEYLVEYCVSKGETGTRTRYMEKIALDWYRKNITTVAQAKEENSSMFGQYHQILGYLGITGRNPVDVEKEYMDRWTDSWSFPDELIREACSRTILQTAQPSLQYADGILKSWHESGAATMEDVQRLDAAHSKKTAPAKAAAVTARKDASGTQTASQAAGASRTGASRNRFNNFDQRQYDFNTLEQQLMRAQNQN